MTARALLKGLLTFIPGIHKIMPRGHTGGTNSAQYCYGVWLKHLSLLWQHGLRNLPQSMAELGPGDSLGIGLAAMLSGTDHYYALDVKAYSRVDTNLQIFDELVALFRARAPRPTRGWPDFDEYLDETLFPSHILDEQRLASALAEPRIAAIRSALQNPDQSHGDITIRYRVPWSDTQVIDPDSVDLILSHSVLEHVVDLEHTYQALHQWLRPGGIMTHQIDFTGHGISPQWNGYRAYSEWFWKLLMGKRSYLINREPHSVHRNLLLKNHFELICDLQNYRQDGIPRTALAGRWQAISDDDLQCSGAFIQARKS